MPRKLDRDCPGCGGTTVRRAGRRVQIQEIATNEPRAMSQNAIDEIEQRLSPELAMMRAERERIAGLGPLMRSNNQGVPLPSPRRIQHGGGGTVDIGCGEVPEPDVIVRSNFICFKNLIVDVSSDAVLTAAVKGSDMLLDLCIPTTSSSEPVSSEVPLAVVVHGQVLKPCPDVNVPQGQFPEPAGYEQFLDLLMTLASKGIAAASIAVELGDEKTRKEIFLRAPPFIIAAAELLSGGGGGLQRISDEAQQLCFIGHSQGGEAAFRAGAEATPPIACIVALAPAAFSAGLPAAPLRIPDETALMTLVGSHDLDPKLKGAISNFQNTHGNGFRFFSIVSGASHTDLGAEGQAVPLALGSFASKSADWIKQQRAAAVLAVVSFLQYVLSNWKITDPILGKLLFGESAIAPVEDPDSEAGYAIGVLKHLQRPQFRPVLDDAFPLSPGRAALVLDSTEIRESMSDSLPANITVPHAGSFRQFSSGPLHELTGPSLTQEQIDLGLDQGEFIPLCDEGDVDPLPAVGNTVESLRRGMRFDWDFPSFPTALEMAVIQIHLGATLHSLLDWAGLGPGRLQDKFLLVDAALIVNAGSNIRQQRNLGSGFQNGESTVVVPWRPMAALASGPLPPTSLDQWVEPTAPLPDHLGYECALYVTTGGIGGGGEDLRETSLSTAVFRLSDLAGVGNLDASSIFLRLSDSYRPLGAAFVSDISLAWLVT